MFGEFIRYSRKGTPNHMSILSKSFVPVLLASMVMTGIAHSTVTVNYSNLIYTQGPSFHGCNFVAFWDDNQRSAGSQNALRRAGVQLIRFPGGIPGDNYNWEVPTQNDLHASKYTQVWTYAQAIGAKLLFQTNWAGLGSTTPATSGTSVVRWVDSCVRFGIDVPIWEVGNEPDNNPVFSSGDTSQYMPILRSYFAKFNEQATAIKAKYPAKLVIGPASTNTWTWAQQTYHPLVIQKFLYACSTHCDGVSIHWYKEVGADVTTLSPQAVYDSTKNSAQIWPRDFTALSKITKKPFYVTEWSSVGPSQTQAADNFAITIGCALVNADMIGAFSKSKIAGHTMFGDIHIAEGGWGLLSYTNENWGTYALDDATPQYFILPIWTKMGDQVISCTSGADSVNALSTWAHKRSSNGHLTVMLINKTGAARNETVNLGYTPKTTGVTIYELRSADGTVASSQIYYNNVKNPVPKTNDLPPPTSATISGTTFTRSLPAYSITLLEFDAPNGSGVQVSNAIAVKETGFTLRMETGTLIVSLGDRLASQDPTVSIYDVSGKLIAQLQPVAVAGAETRCRWDSFGRASGAYVVKLKTATATIVGRINLKM
jgi:hypothetical protein